MVLTILLGLAPAGVAGAQSVTEAEVQALARRAVDDPGALARLRAVRQVDGSPVDIGRGLEGAQGPALASRLRTLAAGGATAGPPVVASEARRDAESVLDGRRFKPSPVPRPFSAVLTAMGRLLQPVLDPFGRLWARVADSLAAQIALAAVVFVVAGAITTRMVGRRSPRSLDRSRAVGVDARGVDPDELERQAASAEKAGELDKAVRLRFVAGLLRLDRAGVIAYRPSMTTGQLRARLRSGPFTELAAAFDEIAYGGRPAEESDVRAATLTWPRVLAEAQR